MEPKEATDNDLAWEELGRTLSVEAVRWVFGAYADIGGRPRGKAVPSENLRHLLGGSEHYTPRGLDGLGAMTPDEECYAVPDPASLRILHSDQRIAVMAADLMHNGEPYSLCTRRVLKDQVARAAALGLRCLAGIETEFYVFSEESCRSGSELQPMVPTSRLRPTPAYDVAATIDAIDFLGAMADGLDKAGFGVYSFDQEGGEGQYEFDFAHDDALAMADKVIFFRLLAKETARRFGGLASFMPKPGHNFWGSGAHLNMSIVDVSGQNVFWEGESDFSESAAAAGGGWSDACYSFVGGVLAHAPALSALSCPTVNSYKRVVPSLRGGGTSWAPTRARFGINDREAMIRLPVNRPAIENRLVDSAANPYLAIAACLGCGLQGIEEQMDPRQTVSIESRAECPDLLPRNLGQAIEAFDRDPLMRKLMSDDLVDRYVEMKSAEWDEYHAVVSEWERDRYLSAF